MMTEIILTPEEEQELFDQLANPHRPKLASEMTEEELRIELAKDGCYDPEWYK